MEDDPRKFKSEARQNRDRQCGRLPVTATKAELAGAHKAKMIAKEQRRAHQHLAASEPGRAKRVQMGFGVGMHKRHLHARERARNAKRGKS